MEWFGLEGTLKSSGPNPTTTTPVGQVAQSPMQLVPFQEWGSPQHLWITCLKHFVHTEMDFFLTYAVYHSFG